MREQLIQYVNLLFAGTQDCEEIRQEILQNTLDRYDDLIAQGKIPEAAYRLAITGIGDISEILGVKPQPIASMASPSSRSPSSPVPSKPTPSEPALNKSIRSLIWMIGLVAYFTVSFLFGGWYLTWLIFPITATLSCFAKATIVKNAPPLVRRTLSYCIWGTFLAVYFAVSLTTAAWYITWIFFPMAGAVQGLVNAILDYKEAVTHET